MVLGAQPAPPPEKPVYTFAGKPVRLEGRCTTEDIHNLGLACTEDEPCPLFLDLVDIEPVGAKLFISGNIHTSDATLASILLASSDGGKTWTEAHDRVPTAGLESIQFLDFESGWIAGQVTLALPRDPFFLLTTDGGQTWRRRPVFGESRVGTIDKFGFDSKSKGQMLIDRVQAGETGSRYELYETMTGGESWMLRQVSPKPIPWKGMSRASTDWRIRPDASSKSFRIEQRAAADKWQLIAAFQVAAGECRPPARTEAVEPPPPPDAPEPAPTAPPARPSKPPSLKKPPIK